VSIIEAPAPQNEWKKLVLRVNRPLSVILIDWESPAQ